jgi:hypothetical protein
MIGAAGLAHAQGNFAVAVEGYRQALEKCRRDLGENHPAFAECLAGLG